jgi:TonB family protein
MEKLMLECIVRSALIALCTAIALFVLRVKAARVRHAVWASVVVLMLALPAWTAWGPKAVLRVLKAAPTVAGAQPVVVMVQDDAVASPVIEPKKTWSSGEYLLGIYLLGFGVLMARLVTGTLRARMLVRRAGGLAGRLTSDACAAPITVGALRPVVILPDGWTEWPEAQLHAVLAHEGEHASRRDPLVQWLALFNRAVFWFHPLSWWLSQRLSALAEEACDDAVLAGGHDPVEYTECLLGLARSVRESGSRVSAVGMAMPGAYLPQRIRRIVEGVPMQRVSRGRMISVAVVCAAVSTVFTTCAIGYAQDAAAPVQNAPATETAPAVETPVPATAPVLHWAPSWQGTRPEVLQLHMKHDGVEVAQNTINIPGKPTDAFGAAFQTLSGVVMDPNGAVVPNAPVTLVNTDTKATISTIATDAIGRYKFENIQPGTYSVMVGAPGFKRETQTGIHVAAGEAHNGGTIFLQLGDVSASISVVGSRTAPVIPTGPIGNSLGDVTALAPKAAAPIGIPLDRNAERGQFVGQFLLPRDAPTGAERPIKVGGNVVAANLVNPIKPVYPPELQRQGVQGTVRLEAIISKDGLAAGLRVIDSPDPALTQAALDAVKQWRYKPTVLNGENVEVRTTIDVNFSLTN